MALPGLDRRFFNSHWIQKTRELWPVGNGDSNFLRPGRCSAEASILRMHS